MGEKSGRVVSAVLATDIEGSTSLLRRFPEHYASLVHRHSDLFSAAPALALRTRLWRALQFHDPTALASVAAEARAIGMDGIAAGATAL